MQISLVRSIASKRFNHFFEVIMVMFRRKLLSTVAVLGALQGCGAVTNQLSVTSAYTDTEAYKEFYQKSFKEACDAIDKDPAKYGEAYVKTLDSLRKQSNVLACDTLTSTFAGKKLDFAASGFPIALDLLIKLQGVQALDLSNNGLKDISGLQERYNGITVNSGKWGTSTEGRFKELRLQNNEITDASVVQQFKYLETLNLANNKIEKIDDVSTSFSGLGSLRVLDLSNNPLSFPESNGQVDVGSFLYKFLRDTGALVYLDVSNTKLQNLDPFRGRPSLHYLIADNLKLNGRKDSMNLIGLQYVSMRNTTGVAAAMFRSSQELIYADFSGSDLNGFENFIPASNANNNSTPRSKNDLTFLFVTGSKATSFDAVPMAPNLAYFGAAHTGFTEALGTNLVLADYRNTQVTDAGVEGQSLQSECTGKERCLQLETGKNAVDLSYTRYFCKSELNAQGECENPHQVCDASTITYKYHSGANSPVKQICCDVPEGVTPSLPGLGEIPSTVDPADGKAKICVDLNLASSFFR
jgi:hypothetical protein